MASTKLAWIVSLTLFATANVAIGCGSGSTNADGPFEVDNGFESDDPSGRTAASRGEASPSGGAADAGAATPSAPGASNGANDSAARAVEEADIIKQEGNRLYALSRYGGLAVVDITDPDHMQLLGRKRTDGMPFEMYVRNGRAYVMLNDFGHYVRNNGGAYGRWVQSSEIVALDVANPAQISELTHFDVPGSIADSRLVGDALYLVTHEDGYCWSCNARPSTMVTSFNVAGAALAKVDQLAYSAPDKTYSAWKRSVSATNERLYIAGPEWSWTPNASNASSIIQVVDITNPSGKLAKGADIAVAGQINSRWQMDEYGGVLRVVSQYGNGWRSPSGSINPQVQTFTIQSSSTFTPLGRTELVLPKPETLQSVRFDGARGYAITSERRDPLFTIDLSDPAKPKQAGQLEMPGWVFYMEPKGDRLVGFGYADATAAGGLAVSLFDVADLTKPSMIKRVGFGSGWGSFAEDQDRIHKSVRVLDDQGLVLVPFASYGRWQNNNCTTPQSGIQIIDYSHDNLALRGVAPQHGMPRRAFVANNRLLAVSDRNVTSFDIALHDAPVKKGELDLSNPAYRLVETGSHVASITNDWWTGEVLFSMTPKANADDAAVTGKVSLASLADVDQSFCSGGSNAWAAWYNARLFANGNYVYVTVPVYTYAANKRGGKVVVAAIDVSNAASPTLVSKTDIALTEHGTTRNGYYGGWYGGGFWDGYAYYSYWGGSNGSLVGSGQGLVQLGAKLAYLEVDYEPYEIDLGGGKKRYDQKVHRKLHVVDFTAPTRPVVHAGIDLGESYGAAPLHLNNGMVLTSRWIRSTKNAEKVRFFADRVDISGSAPVRLPSLNTPGSLLLADDVSGRFVTTDYAATRSTVRDWQDCQRISWRAQFDYDTKQCTVMSRTFKLSDVSDTHVSLRQTFDPPSQNIGGVQIADDRVYVTRYKRYDYSSYAPSSSGEYREPKVLEDGGLWAIGGVRGGQLSIVSQMIGDAEWPLAAQGTKIALYTQGGLAIYDTQTPTPKLLNETNLRGWGYGSHVLLGDDRAICSLGEWGLQTIKY